MRVPQNVLYQNLVKEANDLSLDESVASLDEAAAATQFQAPKISAKATRALASPSSTESNAAPKFKTKWPEDPYTTKFIDFVYENPTTYHAARYFADELTKAGN